MLCGVSSYTASQHWLLHLLRMKNILHESNTKGDVSYSGWNTDFSTAAKFDTADT